MDLTFFPEKFQVGSLNSSFFRSFCPAIPGLKNRKGFICWKMASEPIPIPQTYQPPPRNKTILRAYWGVPYLDGPQCLVEYGSSNHPFLSDEIAKALCPIARELQRRGQEVQIALSRSCFFFAEFGENSFSLQFYQMICCILQTTHHSEVWWEPPNRK